MEHLLRCACGTVAGTVTVAHPIGRAICYCRDCQSYAHVLNKAAEILDGDGGSDVAPTVQGALHFHQGREAIACLSLTEGGLLRWYARCCSTPIGNTARNYRMAYVGLLHSCLEHSAASLDSAFGRVSVRINTEWAKRPVSGTPFAAVAFIARLGPRLLQTRLRGTYRQSPFFTSSGQPIARVRVLTSEELEKARADVLG